MPGLALFYGGLVRTKNMLSVLMQVFAIVCLVMPDLGDLRLQPGLHRRRRLNAFVGGFSKAFLQGVTPNRSSRPSPTASYIPEYVYIASR